MFTAALYGIAFVGLVYSSLKSKQKTKLGLMKSWKMFLNLLPQLTTLFVFVGILLALIDENMISTLLGQQSGITGVAVATVIGSITLLPGFVAFPLASNLLNHGAGLPQIGAFVSSLMMVGIATFTLEAKTVGKKVAFLRNALAFIYAFIIAGVIGGLL